MSRKANLHFLQYSPIVSIDAADDDEIPNPFPFPKHSIPRYGAKNLSSHQQSKFVTAIANIIYTYSLVSLVCRFLHTEEWEVFTKHDFDCRGHEALS